jgi:cytochrome b561
MLKSVQAYSEIQKAIHWGLALLCILEFPTAWSIQKAHLGHAFGIRPPAFDEVLAVAHEWFGWLVLLLAGLLLGSRVLCGAPRLPAGMKMWQRVLAYAAHAAIYVGIVALVVSGVVAMYVDARLAFIHIGLTKIGIGLILLHVGAAIWHQVVRRDGLIGRMLPRSVKAR